LADRKNEAAGLYCHSTDLLGARLRLSRSDWFFAAGTVSINGLIPEFEQERKPSGVSILVNGGASQQEHSSPALVTIAT